jgi:hypothetical protein
MGNCIIVIASLMKYNGMVCVCLVTTFKSMNFTMLLPSIWHFAHRKTGALLISAFLNLVSNRINRSRTAVHSVYDRKTGLVQANGNGS